MEDVTKKKVSQLVDTIVNKGDKLSQYRINNSEFDRTIIGIVIGKELAEQVVVEKAESTATSGDDTETGKTETYIQNRYRWVILSNNTEYYVWETDCDITSIGQEVRLYYPNNSDAKKYAEVIDVGKETYMFSHPKKCTYNSTTHRVTETWELNILDENDKPMTIDKVYQLYIRTNQQGDDEVYKMDLPDGSSIDFEGFVLDKFT